MACHFNYYISCRVEKGPWLMSNLINGHIAMSFLVVQTHTVILLPTPKPSSLNTSSKDLSTLVRVMTVDQQGVFSYVLFIVVGQDVTDNLHSFFYGGQVSLKELV